MPDDMTDEEKHKWCRERGYPSAVFLWPSLYRDAQRLGYDMRDYVMVRPIPPLPTRGPSGREAEHAGR